MYETEPWGRSPVASALDDEEVELNRSRAGGCWRDQLHQPFHVGAKPRHPDPKMDPARPARLDQPGELERAANGDRDRLVLRGHQRLVGVEEDERDDLRDVEEDRRCRGDPEFVQRIEDPARRATPGEISIR